MKTAFARVFGPDENQVLVHKDQTSEGKPCISFSICTENESIVSAAPTYEDTDEGYDLRNKVFSELTENAALEMRDKIRAMAGEINA